MKTSSVSTLLSLVLASLAPAVELVVNPETLSPASTVEMRFDSPMIGKELVGTVDKTLPLVITPAATGEFKWTSTRSGQFRFKPAPALATTYTFALREGMKDQGGAELEAVDLGEYSTPSFTVPDYWRDYPYSYGDSAQRIARFVLQFNDDVNPADAAPLFYFDTETGGQRIPATVRQAIGKDFRYKSSSNIQPTWSELSEGIKPKLEVNTPRPNALVVEASAPLPEGRGWRLIIDPAFKNRSGTAAFHADEKLMWGSVIPLQMKRVDATTHFDTPHEYQISFNKTLSDGDDKPGEAAAKIAPFILVNPPVPNMKIAVDYTQVSITGDFVLNTPYTVEVKQGLPSADGLTMKEGFVEQFTLTPSEVYVSTSAHANSQLSKGNGIFDIYAANHKELRVRVKQLGDGELMKARALYNDTYDTWDQSGKAAEAIKDHSFESFPGTQVYETVFKNDKPLEKATLYKINWKEILGKTPAAPLFVEILAQSQDGTPEGVRVNRSIIEFTDIGLLLKNNGRESLVYAFSLMSGQPLSGATLTFADAERGYLRQAQTDAQGIAVVPGKDAAWVVAKLGDDCTALNFGERDSRIGLWSFDLNVSWESPWKKRHETFLFADRPVYKPGDVAHVKAITRYRTGDDLVLGPQPFKATMTVSDPRGRTVLTKEVTFSANGTWSDDITLPDSTVGWYSVDLAFINENPLLSDSSSEEEESGSASLPLRVDEYKVNTFEVKLDGEKFQVEKDRITVPLQARYFMGKALSSAKVSWNASLMDYYEPPSAYSEYHFGDADSYWHYGKDRDDETADEEEESKPDWGAYGELSLGDDGMVELELPPPSHNKFSLPQTVSVYAEVTDVNQQTISVSSDFILPGADFVLGARKSSWYASSGKPITFDFAAITAKGQPFTAPVPVEVKIERQEWNTVRTEGAGGAITTKNQSTLIEELKSSVGLTSTNNGASEGKLAFTPKKGGTYFMTATSTDAQGRQLLTRVPFYVIGNDGYPWSWEDGERITLQPDKTSVAPGEEVSIVVKSPISGKALVTIERNHVHRQMLVDITPENPVLKLKLTEQDAPNAFVSVILIRGAQDSPQADKMPEYRVGYCELTVKSEAKVLHVEAKPSVDTVQPGEELTVSAVVTNAAKQPVEGAEVTLFAVDEGVLSLMAYVTPNPVESFAAAMPLAVFSYTTVDNLLKEAMDDRYRGNKGVFVGGGGDEASADGALRKNFVATPLWSAALITDKDGKVSSTFKAPDSLTRYRIMAVATKDADRFGSGESAFVINKPLMVEPVVPRFAHVGDELLIKAVVHNTTTFTGTVEVEMKLDETATLIQETRPFALIALKNRTLTSDGRSERRVITLKAGETTALPFSIRMLKHGTASWQWRVKTTNWPDKPLADAVESTFEVTQPAPALREVRYFQLTKATAGDNLLQKVNPQILESEGELRLNLNQSRLGEARDALEHLLHYPYGCVEQTTSSTLPWMTLSKYEPLFPDLLPADKVSKAVKYGANRLLTMQTDEGGLAYWPGGDKPQLWASAYGGFCLIKAKEWGAPVPQDSIDKLTVWMSKQLRELDLTNTIKTGDLNDASIALYTLAKAGKAESAYQTTMYSRRDRLPENARLFLALSMCITKAPEKEILELMKPVTKSKVKWEDYWLGKNTAAGLRLILCAHLGLTAEGNKIADELMRTRNLDGHWSTTFSNSWILIGLSAGDKVSKDANPVPYQLTWNGQTEDGTLATPISSAAATHPFDKNKGAQELKVSVPDGKTVRGRLEIKGYPDLKTFQAVQKGFSVQRRYERLTPLGTLEPAKDLRVGDLIVVTLDINVLKPNRYIALEDPLPSVFEPINPEFTTQNAREDAAEKDNAWFCDHRELRHDKALFFTNDWTTNGKFELTYLARVIAEGDVIAPPTRIEAMYDPEHYGLSDITRVLTLPMGDGGNVVKE